MGEQSPTARNREKPHYQLVLGVNKPNGTSQNPSSYIAFVSFFWAINSSLESLKKIKHCFFGWFFSFYFCVCVFRKGSLFCCYTKKAARKVLPWTESVKNQIISTAFSYYSPASKICTLIVSLWKPIFIWLRLYGHFCTYYWVTKFFFFFLPSSKACFSVLKNWATCLWGESSALFHSHLFFFFGISEACYAQKCFHSSWTIKSIITAVCFLNMNGNEWQQARRTFSFDLSLGM